MTWQGKFQLEQQVGTKIGSHRGTVIQIRQSIGQPVEYCVLCNHGRASEWQLFFAEEQLEALESLPDNGEPVVSTEEQLALPIAPDEPVLDDLQRALAAGHDNGLMASTQAGGTPEDETRLDLEDLEQQQTGTALRERSEGG